MILINVAALIVAVAVVVLVIALIPLIRELKASAIAVREFVVRVDADIQPTIKELHAVLADLTVITAGAADKVEDVKMFMSAVGETGKGLRTISTVVGSVAAAFANSSLWLTGAKVAGSCLVEKLIKKRG